MTGRAKGKLLVFLPLLLALCLLPLRAQAAQGEGTLSFQAASGGGEIRTQTGGGVNWLFLPSHADLSALTLRFSGGEAVVSRGSRQTAVRSGEPFDLTELFPYGVKDGKYSVTVLQGGRSTPLTVMKSEGLRSLYLTSGDPAHGRAWVDASKENRAKDASLLLLGADGHVVYDGGLKDLKGRGHSTWKEPKKPYQIKLAEKTDLLETGDPAEVNRTWVLLANYCDPTMLHNALTMALGEALELPFTPRSQPVDLYYDGEYRGTYFLSEKTEVGTGRVDVEDLESALEDANPETDLDGLPVRTARDDGGREKSFVPGIALPEDWSGGYLLELDYPDRAREERSWFQTARDAYVVCKGPESLPEEAVDYVRGIYQRFEDAVYGGGTDPAGGKTLQELTDLRSLAACYLLFELSEDVDSFQSSTFFYKKQGSDRLYAGPLWDFDHGYGAAGSALTERDLIAGRGYLGGELLSLPVFRQAVKSVERQLHTMLTGGVVPDDQELVLANGVVLRSIRSSGEELAASQRMNAALWPEMAPASYEEILDGFVQRVSRREAWIHEMVSGWPEIVPEERETFSDVPLGKWYHDAVEEMTAAGVFSGVTSFSFAPDQTMTRAMAVTTLYRLAGSPEGNGAAVFRDVSPAKWYGPAAAWAAGKGIAEGMSGGASARRNRSPGRISWCSSTGPPAPRPPRPL